MWWVFDDTLVFAHTPTVLIVVTLTGAQTALRVLATVALFLTFAIQAVFAPAVLGGW